MPAKVSARLVRPLLENPELASVFGEEARTRFGLTLADLDAPDAWVSHDVVVGLIEFAVRTTGDQAMGLHGAMFLGTGVFHILDYMVRTSRTAYEAMQRVGRYSRLLHDGFSVSMIRGDDTEVIKIGFEDGLACPAALADFCMASLFVGGFNMGLPAGALGVYFVHPEVANPREYEELFKAPVFFGASENYATFPPKSFDRALPAADPALCSILERHADQLLARLSRSTPFTEQVRTRLVSELRGGTPTLSHVAKEIGFAPRTLRRRLERDGTTFQAILDELRRDLALSYLDQTDIELEEAAYLLGYSEASAFRRAFKRWTGKSVTEHRRR